MQARSHFRLALCVAFCLAQALAFAPRAWAQAEGARESAVKAAFIYRFASFVEWPAGTFQRQDQPLVIAVAGDDDVAADVEQITAGRTVDGRPVAVRRLPYGSAPNGAHILFLGQRREARLREAIDAATGPVLVITDQPGALRLGSVLNFSTDGGRVRFAASLASADTRNLKLSARLLTVAQTVEGRR